MKDVLIVSATLSNNYSLSKALSGHLKELDMESTVISLENYNLPIYTDPVFDLEKNAYIDTIEALTQNFVNHRGLIICGPEYNGSIPPIINNAIAWISTSTDYWRDAFKDKVALIGTSSGGPGNKFIATMKIQLEHLGCVVMPRSISVNKSNPLDPESVNRTLKQFINFL